MSSTTEYTTATVPQDLAGQARALAGEDGLSAYVIRALREPVRRDRSVDPAVVAAAVDEIHTELRQTERERLNELIGWMEEVNGPTSEESIAAVRAELHRAALNQGEIPPNSTDESTSI